LTGFGEFARQQGIGDSESRDATRDPPEYRIKKRCLPVTIGSDDNHGIGSEIENLFGSESPEAF
jgi:hypothetical protein